jgi:hypothetical protein
VKVYSIEKAFIVRPVSGANGEAIYEVARGAYAQRSSHCTHVEVNRGCQVLEFLQWGTALFPVGKQQCLAIVQNRSVKVQAEQYPIAIMQSPFYSIEDVGHVLKER